MARKIFDRYRKRRDEAVDVQTDDTAEESDKTSTTKTPAESTSNTKEK